MLEDSEYAARGLSHHMAVWPTIFCSRGICGGVRGEGTQRKASWREPSEGGGALTLVRSTPVRALTDTGSSANRRFTSPVTRLPSPLKITISLVLASGAATLPAIWGDADVRVETGAQERP